MAYNTVHHSVHFRVSFQPIFKDVNIKQTNGKTATLGHTVTITQQLMILALDA